jgi:hypothetical protein
MRVNMTHECDNDTFKCDFHTQSAISTRKVWILPAECNFHTKCDFETKECVYDTHDFGLKTHKI